MKLQWIFISVFALFIASCSSSRYVVDDAYYNPKDEVRVAQRAASETGSASEVSEAVPVTEGFEAAQYTEKSGEVIGMYEGDTLALETFEYENGDRDVIVNNYYEGSASYNDYGTRLSRFYGPSVGFGYYSPYYSSFYSPWYYDPWYYSPWYYGPTFHLSFGFGFGWGYPYYYPRYYYPRYYYPVLYDPYVCYYGGYYPSYGYGGGYISDGGSTGYAARRRSDNTSRYSSLDYSADKDYISRVNTNTRRSTTTATRSSSLERTQDELTRRRSAGTQSRSNTAVTDRTIPVRETNQAAYRRTSGTTTRTNTSTEAMKGTRLIPESSSRTSRSRISEGAGRTTNAAANQRYVPRYSNPKTTARPSYNNSSSRSFMKVPTTTRKSTFSAPTRSSSPTYTPPSRSSRIGTSSIGSSRSSGIRSSSGSVSRSSGSVSRSSGSSSRSSGSSGRRR